MELKFDNTDKYDSLLPSIKKDENSKRDYDVNWWDIDQTISELAYLTHDFFRYYGKFPPTIVSYLLKRFPCPQNGCLLDTDKDGVYDYEDLCPTVVGVKENKGCPEVKREIRNLLKKAMSGIQFENGKATIKPSSYKILNDIAKIFIDNTNYIVEVQGHTDNVGKRDYNIDLSERRAQAVRTYLIGKGVPATRLSAHGYGPDVPIADNKTKEGRAKNRRVEFNITFEEVTYETIYDRVQPTDTVQVTDSTVQTTDSITTK